MSDKKKYIKYFSIILLISIVSAILFLIFRNKGDNDAAKVVNIEKTESTNYPSKQKALSGKMTVTYGNMRKPIFFIPGLGGSSLEDTVDRPKGYINTFRPEYDKYCFHTQKTKESVWVNLQSAMIGPPRYCWMDRIKTNWNTQTKKLTNTPGVKTFTKGGIIDGKYEGCAGIKYLSYMPIIGGTPTSDYFNNMISTLESLGYKDGDNLFGLPYDFRLILDPEIMNEYFMNIKNKFEEIRIKSGQRIVVLGHSLGCVLTNLFLSFQPQQWKDEHIDCFISIAGPYGGSSKALRTIISGETEGIPLESNRDMQLVEQNFAGLLWMLPMPEVYNDTLLTKDGITASKIPELLLKLNMPEVEDEYRNLVTSDIRNRSIRDPGVKTHLLYGLGLETENDGYLFYPANDSNGNYGTQNATVNNRDGDGTVVDTALLYPVRNWKSVTPYEINKGEHKEVLNSIRCVQKVVDILTREKIESLCEDICPSCKFGLLSGCKWNSDPGSECNTKCKCNYDYKSLTCSKSLK